METNLRGGLQSDAGQQQHTLFIGEGTKFFLVDESIFEAGSRSGTNLYKHGMLGMLTFNSWWGSASLRKLIRVRSDTFIERLAGSLAC